MVHWVRTFRNTRTGKTFQVLSDEHSVPTLRKRLVRECGCELDWENESIYEHQHLDVEFPGNHPKIDIQEH
jgi:hypothetical protein